MVEQPDSTPPSGSSGRESARRGSPGDPGSEARAGRGTGAAGWSSAPLVSQLRWFIALRQWAGGAIIVGALVDHFWWRWFSPTTHMQMAIVGVFVLAYNFVLAVFIRRADRRLERRSRRLLAVGLGQIVLDLACLAALTAWTGGLASPLLGFFVFHMVFASLLLPSWMAYGTAAWAAITLGHALMLTAQWPASPPRRLFAVGWVITLLFTVFLTNHVTAAMRRHRARLVRQNRRMRAMATSLRQHQDAMLQHEKMIAMGQLAAGVAHEIANPLASMDSLLQLVERRPDRLGAQTVCTLREQVRRINAIVRQLTEFAHPTDAQWREADINQLVEQALSVMRFDRRLKQVRIERRLAPGVGAARVQPHSLQQVLVNLILNAADAMNDVEMPTLTITTSRSDHWLAIAVGDNGHGIRPEHRQRLFEPFFTTKPVGRGTGLGLSISYRLIVNQGGQIDVESTPGAGATFIVRLPVAPAATTAQQRDGKGTEVPIPEKNRT